MSKKISILCLCTFLLVSGAKKLFAGEVDTLVNKLAKKRIVTPLEAPVILDETKASVAKEIAQGKSTTLPSWIQAMKLKGDFRLRYQQEEKNSSNRERARIRFRLGGSANVVSNWKVNFGFATGSDDPRSTNQTFQDNFSTKGINLDYAYITHTPCKDLTLEGGKLKIKNTIWIPSDLLWDGDITPEGFSARLTVPGTSIFVHSAYFVLDEASKSVDPSMAVIQPGIKFGITKNAGLKVSANYYLTNSLKGSSYGNIVDGGETNTLNGDDTFTYDYDALGFSAQLDIKKALFNYLALFADYVKTGDPQEDNTGYLFGIKFGDKKLKSKGQWQAKVLYRELEKDAWLDFLPDSDFLGGETGAKGYEAVVQYVLEKNLTFGLDYYKTETIDGKIKQDLAQLDLVAKF